MYLSSMPTGFVIRCCFGSWLSPICVTNLHNTGPKAAKALGCLVWARLHHMLRSEASGKTSVLRVMLLLSAAPPARAKGQLALTRLDFQGEFAQRVLGLEPGSAFFGGARLPNCELAASSSVPGHGGCIRRSSGG